MIARPRDDADYFHARALEEQAAAQLAKCPEAQRRHDEMATIYRFKESLARTCPPAFRTTIETFEELSPQEMKPCHTSRV